MTLLLKSLVGGPLVARMACASCVNRYHERLVLLDMEDCGNLERFPPIIRMRKLETLNLSKCRALEKFEIRASMDSLVELRLNNTCIKIVPSSIGQFCTNLLSFDFSRRENPYKPGLVDLTGCLDALSISCSYEINLTWLMNCFGFSYQDSLSRRLPPFPCSLRKLNLGSCGLRDGDIPSHVFELLNLQVMVLGENEISRLPSLSRLKSLKCLSLSWCDELVEIPDLPPSMVVLDMSHCFKLEQVGDLSIYKCLSKVSLAKCDKLLSWGSVVTSLLQETVVRNSFMSVQLPLATDFNSVEVEDRYTLQIPHNWYNNFNGFLLCLVGGTYDECSIVIDKEETCTAESQDDKNLNKGGEYGQVGYVPFASLRHTSWWNSAHNNAISFSLKTEMYGHCHIAAGLVLKSKGTEATIDCSQVWDENVNGGKTFSIVKDSKSSIEIYWNPRC